MDWTENCFSLVMLLLVVRVVVKRRNEYKCEHDFICNLCDSAPNKEGRHQLEAREPDRPTKWSMESLCGEVLRETDRERERERGERERERERETEREAERQRDREIHNEVPR